MKKLLTLLFLFVVVSNTIIGQVGKTYYVSVQSLNLRSEPSTTSDIVEKLQKYDNLILVEDKNQNDWFKVKVGKQIGFVKNSFVKKGKSVVSSYSVRTGAVCKDGTSSYATGRGACSHHGGVSYWKTTKKQSVSIIDN